MSCTMNGGGMHFYYIGNTNGVKKKKKIFSENFTAIRNKEKNLMWLNFTLIQNDHDKINRMGCFETVN